MGKILLLPHRFQKIGWALLVPSLLLGSFIVFNGHDTSGLAAKIEYVVRLGREVDIQRLGNGIEPWLNNFIIISLLLGAVFVTCSRERVEDEMIAHIRLNALLTALYVHTAVVIVAALAVYGLAFVDVMVYNLFTLPLLFTAIYRWQLRRMRKEAGDEE